ncbi:MAG: complex I subunit 1 family protein [Spirochaetota bacterium]
MDILSIAVTIVLFLLLAPLYEGIVRKVIARVQSRKGPPVIQPYRDLLKLLGKENMSAGNALFTIAPLLAFASILGVIAFFPLGYHSGWLAQHADVITIVYLLTVGGVSVMLGGLASRNTYAGVGASREMITMIMLEPVLAMTFLAGAVKAKSLGILPAIGSVAGGGYDYSTLLMLFVYLLALMAFVGRQPFDIAEAEVEILEGPFIEYSGPNYALFRYYLMLKQMFYASLFVVAFLPIVRTGTYGLDVLIELAAVSVIFVLVGLIGSTNPRMRIDQAQKYYGILILLALASVGLSVYGL